MADVFEPRERARTRWDMERVITWDVEAHNWGTPIAVGAVTPDGTYREWTTDDHPNPIVPFVQWAMRPKWRNHRFVAHNGGSYDFGFILDELIGGSLAGLSFRVFKAGDNSVFYLPVRDRDDKPRHFQDSIAILPRPLDYLADSFAPDLPKLDPSEADHPIDVTDLPATVGELDDGERATLSEYLERDCRTLRAVLGEFSEIVADLTDGRTGPQLTIGSTTIAAYQTSAMRDESIDAIVHDRACENASREAYFGGRTEVFRQAARPDDGPFYHYDVNSLFPYCYTRKPLPVGRPTHLRDPDTDQVLHDMTEFGGPVRVSLDVPRDVDVPPIPGYAEVADGATRLAFCTGPHGERHGPESDRGEWLMLREVRYALDAGLAENVEIHEAFMCRLDYPFKTYGERLYDLKRSIDGDEEPGRYNVVKLLLNSFYGKWGMSRTQTEVEAVDPDDVDDWPPEGYRTIADGAAELALDDAGVVEKDTESEADYIVPRLAAAITAEARVQMHKWFTRVRDEGGRLWYCDTDSIVTDTKLPDRYLGEDMGLMDHEATIAEGYFLRPKTYAEKHADDCPCPCGGGGTTLKGKGMRRLSDHTDFADFRAAFDDDDPGRVWTEWDGPRGLWSAVKEHGGGVIPEDYDRSLTGFDDKREHSRDGTNSHPHDLRDLAEARVEREASKRRAKVERDRGQVAFAAQVEDDAHEADSTLSAAENKEELWKRRVEKAKDRDMFGER